MGKKFIYLWNVHFILGFVIIVITGNSFIIIQNIKKNPLSSCDLQKEKINKKTSNICIILNIGKWWEEKEYIREEVCMRLQVRMGKKSFSKKWLLNKSWI